MAITICAVSNTNAQTNSQNPSDAVIKNQLLATVTIIQNEMAVNRTILQAKLMNLNLRAHEMEKSEYELTKNKYSEAIALFNELIDDLDEAKEVAERTNDYSQIPLALDKVEKRMDEYLAG